MAGQNLPWMSSSYYPVDTDQNENSFALALQTVVNETNGISVSTEVPILPLGEPFPDINLDDFDIDEIDNILTHCEKEDKMKAELKSETVNSVNCLVYGENSLNEISGSASQIVEDVKNDIAFMDNSMSLLMEKTIDLNASIVSSTQPSRRKMRQATPAAPYPQTIIYEDRNTWAHGFNSVDGVLGINNGGRGRKQTVVNRKPTTSSFVGKKRKKYEMDDSQDKSVKNAKTARINREKNKQEKEILKQENERLARENYILQQKLEETKHKNEISNGVLATSIKTVLESIVPSLNATCGGPMHVVISDTFANMPVQIDAQGNVLGSKPQASSSFQAAQPMSTYSTYHISPQERMIVVDNTPFRIGRR